MLILILIGNSLTIIMLYVNNPAEKNVSFCRMTPRPWPFSELCHQIPDRPVGESWPGVGPRDWAGLGSASSLFARISLAQAPRPCSCSARRGPRQGRQFAGRQKCEEFGALYSYVIARPGMAAVRARCVAWRGLAWRGGAGLGGAGKEWGMLGWGLLRHGGCCRR